MKIKQGYILREIIGNYVVVPTGTRVVEFDSLLTLSESGAFLWRLLENEADIDKLVKALIGEYIVDEEKAKKDVEEFLAILNSKGLLQ